MNDTRRFSEDSMFVKVKDEYRRIEFSDILYMEAAGGNSTIHLKDTQLLLSCSLAEIQSYLPHSIFLRIHRGYITNKQYISALIGNTLSIGETKLPIGRNYKSDLLSSFHILGKARSNKEIENKQD